MKLSYPLRGVSRSAGRIFSRASRTRSVSAVAISRAADHALRLARRYSSLRDHSLAELRRIGHPYSRRWGRDSGPHPDWAIHRQSGQLYGAWHRDEPRFSFRGITVKIWNDAAHARFMRGTRRMRPRPILAQVQRDLRRKAWRQTMENLRKTLRS